ncbi:MAG: hypothetical protein AAGE76_15665 [Pseudomonadota bacterium]
MRKTGILLGALLAAAFAPPAGAGEVIVSREGDGMAVYFRMPLSDVRPLFGNDVSGLMGSDGRLTPDLLAQGTFDGADLLARDVAFTLGARDVAFEALSMMVHPAETPLRFDDPLSAQMAIAVCGVPLPEAAPQPEDLVWVGGWYAYPVPSGAALTIDFPQTDRAPLDLSVRVFDAGHLKRDEKVTLADDGTIHVPGTAGWRRWLSGG